MPGNSRKARETVLAESPSFNAISRKFVRLFDMVVWMIRRYRSMKSLRPLPLEQLVPDLRKGQ
jgi:hypothetical protein